MLTHCDESRRAAASLEMLAMLEQDVKALVKTDRHRLRPGVAKQRLLRVLLAAKNPGIALRAAADENAVHTSLPHPVASIA